MSPDACAVVIRPYEKKDREAVRDIAWETAFRGEPADVFFGAQEILKDFLTLYFTDFEGSSCFTAEAQGRVVGYLLGARDIKAMQRVFLSKIFSKICGRAAKERVLSSRKNIAFLLFCLKSWVRGEFRQPDFSGDYPAVLHINIKKDFRGCRIGGRLLEAFFGCLSRQKVPGVQLATMSEPARVFFEKKGFKVLYQGRRTYFNFLGFSEVPIYMMAKSLP